MVDVVRRQKDLGVDVPGDGEYGKSMGHRVNYGAWWHYSFSRLGGLDPNGPALYDMPAHRSQPGQVALTSFSDRRDRQRFAAAYADPESGITTGPRAANWPICVGPITYIGQDAIAARHRQLQGGAAGRRSRGRLHDRDRAGQCLPHWQSLLQDRRRVHVRLRRRDARGVQGDHRRGACPAARRSVDRRELGSDQSGAQRRGLQASSPCCGWRR